MGKHHKEPTQAIMTEDGEVTGDHQIRSRGIQQILHKPVYQ